MSWRVLARVVDESPSVRGGRLVLLCLADACADHGVYWAGYGDLERRANMSCIGLRKALGRLAADDEIRMVSGSGHESSIIVLARYAVPDALAAFLSSRDPAIRPIRDEVARLLADPGGVTKLPPGGNLVTPRGKESYPELELTRANKSSTAPHGAVGAKSPNGPKGKTVPSKRARPPRARDPLFDAFCETVCVNPDQPGRYAGLAGDFSARCKRHPGGPTPADFKVFMAEIICRGDWGRYVKSHNLAEVFLSWLDRRQPEQDSPRPDQPTRVGLFTTPADFPADGRVPRGAEVDR